MSQVPARPAMSSGTLTVGLAVATSVCQQSFALCIARPKKETSNGSKRQKSQYRNQRADQRGLIRSGVREDGE